MWNEIFRAVSVNKNVSHQGFQPSKCMFLSPGRIILAIQQPWATYPSKWERKVQESAIYHIHHPLRWRKNWGCEQSRSRMLAPDSWDAYECNKFNDARHLHLPIHRRVLNPLCEVSAFPKLTITLMFRLPVPCWKLTAWLLPPPP